MTAGEQNPRAVTGPRLEGGHRSPGKLLLGTKAFSPQSELLAPAREGGGSPRSRYRQRVSQGGVC